MFTARTVTSVAIVVVFAAFLAGYVLLDKKHGDAQQAAQTMIPYSSEEGVSFMYPDTYVLNSSTHKEGSFTWDSLDLVDKNYVAPVNGEGPNSISMSVFLDAEGLPLEEFLKSEPKTNYQLSTAGTLTKGTIGGQQSLAYKYSGLYEFDATAVLYKGKVFIFTNSWQNESDQIRKDFNKVLSSVTFN